MPRSLKKLNLTSLSIAPIRTQFIWIFELFVKILSNLPCEGPFHAGVGDYSECFYRVFISSLYSATL